MLFVYCRQIKKARPKYRRGERNGGSAVFDVGGRRQPFPVPRQEVIE